MAAGANGIDVAFTVVGAQIVAPETASRVAAVKGDDEGIYILPLSTSCLPHLNSVHGEHAQHYVVAAV